MDAVTNPYTPGAGSKPPALMGRDAEIDQLALVLARLELGRHEKSMLINGLRGVGKTVLLNTFKTMAQEQGWYSVKFEIRHDTNLRATIVRHTKRLLLDMRRTERLKAQATRALRVLKAFSIKTPDGFEFGVDVEAMVGTADSGDLEIDLGELLAELGRTAQEDGKGVIFLIDEIQFLNRSDLEALIAALHHVTQDELPVAIAGGGLPTLPRLAGEAKSYSERLFMFPRLGTLTSEAASLALTIPAERLDVEFEPDAVELALELSDGYPYFLQEYGKHAWTIGKNSKITRQDVADAHPRVLSDLDEGFFDVRLRRVTPRERRYIAAMASLGDGPQETSSINELLKRTNPGSTSPIRAELIDKGLIYSPARGTVDFTVPHFADFMRRTAPFDPATTD